MKLIQGILNFFTSDNPAACPSLIGTWQSSREMSSNYNREHAKITDTQFEFIEQIIGTLRLTYSETSIHEHGAEPLKITIKSEPHEFFFEDSTHKYEVLNRKKDSIKIKQYYPHGKPFKTKVNFINENTYWVEPDNLPTSREYFTRVSS